jgi:hypothetical protein
MNGCQGNTSACTGRDLVLVKMAFRPNLLVMCAACRSTATGMGARIVERRHERVPVSMERRQFIPEWRRNLTARDETGRVA